MSGLLVIGKETRKVNRRDQVCIIFCHDQFPDQELYCCARFCNVLNEGHSSDFFSLEEGAGDVEVESSVIQNVNEGVEEGNPEVETMLPGNYESLQGTAKDIQLMRDLGFYVDDDNDPHLFNSQWEQ